MHFPAAGTNTTWPDGDAFAYASVALRAYALGQTAGGASRCLVRHGAWRKRRTLYAVMLSNFHYRLAYCRLSCRSGGESAMAVIESKWRNDMPGSRKQDTSRRVPPEIRPEQQAHSLSSALPSSPGDSSLHVMPKDISSDDASWKDLIAREVRPRSAGLMVTHAPPEMDEQAFRSRRAGPSADQPEPERMSSSGDSPVEVTPKDITPQDASWHDLTERKIASGDAAQREESILDEAIELSFPASDPSAELPASARARKTAPCEDDEEFLLDEAIELTFPASDPIAFSPPDMTYRTVKVRSNAA